MTGHFSPELRAQEWRARIDGLVPAAIENKNVLLAGCGSVGSFIACELVRTGARKLILIDPDIVEWPNLSRTTYLHGDVGKPKVHALREQLLSIFPDVDVTAHATTLQELRGGLEELIEQSDLIVSAVDQPSATGRLNRLSFAANKPAVFVGLYRGAKGGEIVVTVPATTPCYNCSTGGVRRAAEEIPEPVARTTRDYGTNRLVAEIALGSDIHFVSAAAVKVILSMLSHDSAGPLGTFMRRQLSERSNFVMFGMEPDYYLFPSTHSSALGQYAFQSLWVATSVDPECEVCGPLS